MKNRKLEKKILEKLMKKTGRKEKTIRKDLAILRSNFSGLPINSVAQIYAKKNNTTIHTLLTSEEKNKVPNLEFEKPIKIKQSIPSKKTEKKIIQYLKYDTTDTFIKAHIDEINKAYTFHCYTAAFILCRKIIENLLTDIIRKKYPKMDKSHLEIYFDTSQGRTKDFSIIKNLRQRSLEFGPDRTLLERLLNKASQFKDDANDKTHSWYHIVRNSKELDEKNVQDIINMIKTLETNIEQQKSNP